jgi:ketosteroid isomerase-like protein
MRTRYQAALLGAALSIAPLSACTTARVAPPPVVDAQADEQAVRSRVMDLLARYEANDAAGVIAMLDPVKFTMLGTGPNERVESPEQLRALMESDFRLWGSARFTDVRDFDLRSDGTLATANFVMSFSASGNGPIPIRLTTTWRKVNGEWRLTQSTSSMLEQRG